MKILSLTATCRLAERIVRKAGKPVPVEELVALIETYDVERERARAGVRLACTVGRLVATDDLEGRPCVQLPDRGEEVA